ncbi:MAG TPA: hypothetical protein V6C58_02200, partial [Allocoleopsis sp.]
MINILPIFLMTPNHLIQLAQQGDINAINSLLNNSFDSAHLTIQTNLEPGCLIIIVSGENIINQVDIVNHIRDLMLRVKPPLINLVKIQGKSSQNNTNIWQDEFSILKELSQINSEQKSNYYPRKPAKNYNFFSRFARVNLDKEAYTSLGIGLFLAILISSLQFLSFALSYFVILVHELGHTFAGWLFGYPSIPAFNFVHGGGMTLNQERADSVMILIYLALGFLFYYYRKKKGTLIFLAVFTLIYSWIAFNNIHQGIITFMGHGFELIFTGIFLYRGFSGYGLRLSLERPLYYMLAFFTFFKDVGFAWNLIYNSEIREIYEEGIGGVIDNDFVILARDFFHVNLSQVSGLFLVLTFLTPIITFLLFVSLY